MGNSSSLLPEEWHVVIVGGGFAGARLAHNLKGKCKFTLIDGRDGMHYAVASLRASVESGFAEHIFIPYTDIVEKDSFKKGTVTGIDPENKIVKMENGEEIIYTHLVISTGTSVPFPGKLPLDVDMSEGKEIYAKLVQEIEKSNNIVIIGGGAVGVEMATEIAEDHPKKQVTVIHSKQVLVSDAFSNKFHKETRRQLDALGVKLILGEKVENMDDLPDHFMEEKFKVTTNKGNEIEANLIIKCTGTKVNTSAYAESLGGSMDEIGQLKVNDFFEVEGQNQIFAIGDCCNTNETKMAFRAGFHADLIVQNFIQESKGNKKHPYKPKGPIMILSLGRNGGVFQINSFNFGSFAARKLKSKDMMVNKYYKDLGLKPPKK
ncbi:ferroptosis suppressor protein 1-like [Saccoglossus kowalevskii]|uniref:Ferroptosis suppressor protein 1 n=1 Tax=Saccoglossus kowalevskii TaxID=10224 RepID=A0ABM0MUE3_SACKO|nr:PREDICTED: apoptosis-inducing factor 2-like [Saccoglossus kowalevskii]